MTIGIDTGRRIDLGAAIAPEGRDMAPHTLALVEADAALHDGLVHDAFERLGSPGDRPLDPWRELARAGRIDRADGSAAELSSLRARDSHALRVDLGSSVVLPGRPFDPDTWTVVGVRGADRIHLERRIDDVVQHRTMRWPALLSANPSLAEHWRGTGPVPLHLRATELDAGFPAATRSAFDLRQATLPPAQRAMELVTPTTERGPGLVTRMGTWGELSTELRLSRLRPLGALPSDAMTAVGLVDAASPVHRVVEAADSEVFTGQSLLVGAGTIDPAHRAAPDAALLEDISQWFADRGLPTWRDSHDSLLLTSGHPDSIANASAMADSSFAHVRTGPRDPIELRELTNLMDRDAAISVRASQQRISGHWRAVLAHEVGHTTTQQLWGNDAPAALARALETKDMPTIARLAEHDIAGEAFSDLLGAAYTDSRSVGVRALGRLRNGMGDLDQLRATLAKAGTELDVHLGTQLLTKPMLAVQEAHGSDAMAEVAGSAAKQLGAMLGRGEIQAIDLPVAAAALRDAAAMRWGLEDGLVQGLTKAWQGLRVLR